jgi:hypothetical protein
MRFLLLGLAAAHFFAPRGVKRPVVSFVAANTSRAPVGKNLLRELSRLLTCPTLENEALKQCSVVPVYEAIAQFAGSKVGCEKTYRSSSEFRTVLSYFFGNSASCSTSLEKWQFHLNGLGEQKFADGAECVEHVRTYDFASSCVIPGGAPTKPPTTDATTTAAPVAGVAGAAPAAGAAGAAEGLMAAGPGPASESATTPPLPVPNAETTGTATAATAATTATATTATTEAATATAATTTSLLRKQRLAQMAGMVFD